MFRLTVDDICSLEGYSQPSALKLIDAIYEARTNRSLHRVIVGLGLPGIAKIGSKEFPKKIQSLHNLVSSRSMITVRVVPILVIKLMQLKKVKSTKTPFIKKVLPFYPLFLVLRNELHMLLLTISNPNRILMSSRLYQNLFHLLLF